MKNLILENDSATKKLGQKISEIIKSSDKQNIEIHLQGDLGAGKTFMTRSIINNCGWEDLVKSPTYTLCEEYDFCLLYTSPSPRDRQKSRMPSSA